MPTVTDYQNIIRNQHLKGVVQPERILQTLLETYVEQADSTPSLSFLPAPSRLKDLCSPFIAPKEEKTTESFSIYHFCEAVNQYPDRKRLADPEFLNLLRAFFSAYDIYAESLKEQSKDIYDQLNLSCVPSFFYDIDSLSEQLVLTDSDAYRLLSNIRDILSCLSVEKRKSVVDRIVATYFEIKDSKDTHNLRAIGTILKECAHYLDPSVAEKIFDTLPEELADDYKYTDFSCFLPAERIFNETLASLNYNPNESKMDPPKLKSKEIALLSLTDCISTYEENNKGAEIPWTPIVKSLLNILTEFSRQHELSAGEICRPLYDVAKHIPDHYFMPMITQLFRLSEEKIEGKNYIAHNFMWRLGECISHASEPNRKEAFHFLLDHLTKSTELVCTLLKNTVQDIPADVLPKLIDTLFSQWDKATDEDKLLIIDTLIKLQPYLSKNEKDKVIAKLIDDSCKLTEKSNLKILCIYVGTDIQIWCKYLWPIFTSMLASADEKQLLTAIEMSSYCFDTMPILHREFFITKIEEFLQNKSDLYLIEHDYIKSLKNYLPFISKATLFKASKNNYTLSEMALPLLSPEALKEIVAKIIHLSCDIPPLPKRFDKIKSLISRDQWSDLIKHLRSTLNGDNFSTRGKYTNYLEFIGTCMSYAPVDLSFEFIQELVKLDQEKLEFTAIISFFTNASYAYRVVIMSQLSDIIKKENNVSKAELLHQLQQIAATEKQIPQLSSGPINLVSQYLFPS